MFSLITKVLQPWHSIVLDDWLQFLTVRPAEVVVYVPGVDGTACLQAAQVVCEAHNVPVAARIANADEDLRNRETDILLRLAEAAHTEYVFLVNLDTLPYRSPGSNEEWLQDVFDWLTSDPKTVFFSACGFLFEKDSRISGTPYFRTQRFSNNCGLVRKAWWQACLQRPSLHASSLSEDRYRYHSEWAIEEVLAQDDLFGLRREDSLEWRIFHVQQWDERLLATRELFRAGTGLEGYLNRVHERTLGQPDYYFNYPKPGLLRRLRISLGKARRSLLRL